MRRILTACALLLWAGSASAQNVNVVTATPITNGLTTIDGHVDGIETLIGTSNTSLALIAGLVNSLGSTTSGSKGILGLCASTTAAPTYTTTQSNALSCDTSGALRVVGSTATTQYAEDAAHVSGNLVVAIGAVRSDTTPSSTAGTAGDYAIPNLDGNGRLYTNSVAYDAAGTAVTFSADAQTDSASTSSGPQIQVEAKDFDGSALPTPVSAEGDAVKPAASLYGVQYVMLVNENGSLTPIDSLGRLLTKPASICQDEARVSSVPIDTASSGNNELVALTASSIIYVCGYAVVANAAVAVQFIYGTGTACATGETDLTGPMPFGANGGALASNGGTIQFKGAVSNALCVELSAGVQVSGYLTYVKTAAP